MMSRITAILVTNAKELIGKDLWGCSTYSQYYATICRKFDKFTAELHPIPVHDEVWHTIGVGLIGPLPTTARGNKYIMTVSCSFSKWPEATALEDKSAIGVQAEFLLKCLTRHGCCKVKISDQGREFVNELLQFRLKNLFKICRASSGLIFSQEHSCYASSYNIIL